MGQLPRAGHAEHTQLDQTPAHDARVDGFTLIAKFGFSFLE
jgi:hypothetical protein